MINKPIDLQSKSFDAYGLSKPQHAQQIPQNLTQVKDYVFNTDSVIGKGSMSIVYKAVDVRNNEIVGVKKVNKKALNSEYLITSLLSEISIHEKVRHPNIVGLKDVIRSTNNIYIVLEYCNSGTLRDYLKKKGKLTESEAIEILNQIVEGMDSMIKNDIIHRDIKPENILCHYDKGVFSFKICDFGFSKKLAEKDQMLHSAIGSPQYMDLQRLCNEGYSSKSDVFSLGIIAYEMLFGCPPWSASNWHDLKDNLISKPLKIPSGIVSYGMESFIKRTLEIREYDRASWDEVKSSSLFKKY